MCCFVLCGSQLIDETKRIGRIRGTHLVDAVCSEENEVDSYYERVKHSINMCNNCCCCAIFTLTDAQHASKQFDWIHLCVYQTHNQQQHRRWRRRRLCIAQPIAHRFITRFSSSFSFRSFFFTFSVVVVWTKGIRNWLKLRLNRDTNILCQLPSRLSSWSSSPPHINANRIDEKIVSTITVCWINCNWNSSPTCSVQCSVVVVMLCTAVCPFVSIIIIANDNIDEDDYCWCSTRRRLSTHFPFGRRGHRKFGRMWCESNRWLCSHTINLDFALPHRMLSQWIICLEFNVKSLALFLSTGPLRLCHRLSHSFALVSLQIYK